MLFGKVVHHFVQHVVILDVHILSFVITKLTVYINCKTFKEAKLK